MKRKRWMMSSAGTVACLVAASWAWGDAPDLKYFYPAGLRAGSTTTIECTGDFEWPVRVDAIGAEVEVTEEKGKLAVHVPHGSFASRVWLRMYNDDGASPLVPLLVGNLPEAFEVEPNDSANAAQKLSAVAPPPGDTELLLNGRLQERDDVDCFLVQLEAGQLLVAHVDANQSFGSPMDAILQIAKPDGTVLAENHDRMGLDPRIVFTAPWTGQFVVRLFAFPANPNQQIRFHGGDDYVYRLTLTSGPFVTHAIPMCVPKAEATENAERTVEVFGWNVPPGTRLPVHRLEEQAADLGIVRAPRWSGEVLIQQVASNFAVVKDGPPTDRVLPIPNSVSGCLHHPGDLRQFRFGMEAGQAISIQVDALKFGSEMVPAVRLVDAKGAVVAETPENGASGDTALSYTAKAAGEYQLLLRDRFGHGGPQHFYCLKVFEPPADYELSLESDRFVLDAGKSLEIPVKVTRRKGSGGPIEKISITAVDLPTGISSDAVDSLPEGDTAGSVSLKLQSTRTEGFSGAIRIVGSTENAAGASLARTAGTPARFGRTFRHAWLTAKSATESSGTNDDEQAESTASDVSSNSTP